MSIRFDASGSDQSIHANHASMLVPTIPFSVSLRVYFDSIPGAGTQVIWWYCDKDGR